MFIQITLIVTAVKILFINFYHSTDFEVHRNWLAVTHNLPTNQWYYESTSEWTLDYPPLFAWFEYGLSHVARFFDPEMLVIKNLNYASNETVIFQRLSVIVTDLVYAVGVKRCSDLISNGKLLAYILLFSNPGLLMVDHIHFQYNGFLFGILLLSISDMIKGNHLMSAFWFTILLNLKHIYLYIAPAYIIYLLRAYCFTVPSKDGQGVAWYSFSLKNLLKLGFIVSLVFGISFGPFIHHLPQVLSRLFPFKRGLCHSYWAPNFWALYNVCDKILAIFLTKLGITVNKVEGSMTGGLVQEYDHSVLPSIRPIITLVLTVVSITPALKHLWTLGADKNYRAIHFVRCMLLCATSAFLFGWHVHEKAILISIIPLCFLAMLDYEDGKMFLLLSTVGHYSIFPLLYPKDLLPVKLFMLLTYAAVGFHYIPNLFEPSRKVGRRKSVLRLPMLNRSENLYILGLLGLLIYENIIHSYIGWQKTLPFFPLMLTSVYCSVGVMYFWLRYYIYFLKIPVTFVTVKSKKVK